MLRQFVTCQLALDEVWWRGGEAHAIIDPGIVRQFYYFLALIDLNEGRETRLNDDHRILAFDPACKEDLGRIACGPPRHIADDRDFLVDHAGYVLGVEHNIERN